MKTLTLVLILFLTGLDLWAQTPPGIRTLPTRNRSTNNPAGGVPSALPSLPLMPTPAVAPSLPSALPFPGPTLPLPGNTPNNSSQPQKEVPGYTFQYEGVDLAQVLDVYASLDGRTQIRGALPQASIVLKTQSPLTKSEAIVALQAVLAANGISLIPMNDKFIKVLPTDQAAGAGGKLDLSDTENLPDMGSYVTHIVQLQYVKPSVMQPIIAPLAKINSIIPIDDNGILVIRDYAENVKRMLEMIQQIDVNTPQEYTNEVIEIKYALAEDIANALNSLGGTGGATVSIGTTVSTPAISGIASPRGGGTGTTPFGASGVATPYGGGGQRTFGTQGTATPATPNGTPTGGTTFQDRLRNIIANASRPTGGGAGQQEQIQVFGQAKIIADARANSLLVFATKADMERIKAVVAKLDVLLSQVLIEAVIIDYGLGPNTFNFGVSAVQAQQGFSSNPQIQGAGGMNNGQPFYGFLNSVLGAATNGIPTGSPTATPSTTAAFGNSLPGALSYFGSIGPRWDIALQAAASDSHASIIQRPRIQTSQAKPAQFFVGETVPYVTGTSFGTGINGANSSTYSQLSVGVELDVTPFINPEGLVVMDINQEIDDLDGSTPIIGVGNVPNTDKRTLSSEIAVEDRDTVMLGGFIKNQKSTAKSGIPLLMNIPILGNLFSSRSDTKQREELIVLMRPTVLKTPKIAAQQTLIEEQRLPGISQVSKENDEEEANQIEAERKAEQKRAKVRRDNGGFVAQPVPTPSPAPIETNMAVPLQ